MDEKYVPMEAEILDMPSPAAATAPTGYYGTAVPQKPKRNLKPLWIACGLLVILFCSASVVISALDLRLSKNDEGRWTLSAVSKPAGEAAAAGNEPRSLTLPEGSEETQSGQEQIENNTELMLRRSNVVREQTGDLTAFYQKARKSVVCVRLETAYDTRTMTGVILSEDGYVLSASEAVNGAVSVSVLLSDDTELPAKKIRQDPVTGLILFKADAAGLTPAEFGDMRDLTVGDTVLSIGNPYGVRMRGVLAEGIVSAVSSEDVGGRTLTLLQSTADFEAPCCGSPIYNRYGQIVALTAPVGTLLTEDGSDPGFAICAADLQQITTELLAEDAEQSVWLGIEVETIPEIYLAYFSYPGEIWISSLDAQSRSGRILSLCDVVTAVDGTAVSTPEEFEQAVGLHAPGETVSLTIYRDGRWYVATLPVLER